MFRLLILLTQSIGPRLLVGLFIVAAPVLSPTRSCAQDLDPRAYANIPVGMNFVALGYGYSEGSVTADASAAIEDAEVDAHAAIVGYARSIDFFGRSGKVDAIVSAVCTSGSALLQGVRGSRDVCGMGDPRLRLSVNLFGAPALTLKEFSKYRQNFIVGASLQVIAPLGQYNSDRILNVGTNRWTFKPEFGISKRIGSLTLELSQNVSIYTDNDDFVGGQRLERDPMFASQLHVIYGLRSGIWASVDGTYYTGGRTEADGVRKDDQQENTRFGFTISVPVTKRHSLKLLGSTGTTSRIGTDFDAIGVAWLYRWGGGI
jgi:hypothetical protein